MNEDSSIVNLEAGNILKAAIKEHESTQIEIAKSLDLSTKQLQNYSKGVFPKYKGENIKKLDELLKTAVYPMIYKRELKSENKVSRGELDGSILNLTVSSQEISKAYLLNQQNIERLISLLEKREEGIELDEAGSKGTVTYRKKKTGHD